MPKTRTIKHDFFLDEDLAMRSHQARILFIGLWLLADRDGRLEDRPLKIKAQIFPYGSEDVNDLLAELDGHFIHRYIHKETERAYIQIVAFKKHQHIHPDEKSNSFPPYHEIPGNPRKSPEIMHNGPSSVPYPSPSPKLPQTPLAVLKVFGDKSVDNVHKRIPFGPNKDVYISSLTPEECRRTLTKAPRLSQSLKAALKARIAEKEAAMTDQQRKERSHGAA